MFVVFVENVMAAQLILNLILV
ncbi:Protein of unknown function [Bacillus cytotoxicus]|uniref:Uncharacterized protein n=1 Tax=Bacillus cytotoxicus TaxID=580165 RepID=A0AAX2CPA9_9BACI|nr:Protein of unknown function [Bacillus cytotoxicus]